VVAAGGIGTGRAMAAALAAGASAVRVGTRFVASEEAGALPAYVDKLIAADAKDTILTEAFSTNWPNAPHRVLRSCVEAVERFQGDVVGETAQPWAPEVRVPIRRGDSFVADRTTTGEIDARPLWAGESVGGVKRLQPAGEIVRELADEAEALLRTWGTRTPLRRRQIGASAREEASVRSCLFHLIRALRSPIALRRLPQFDPVALGVRDPPEATVLGLLDLSSFLDSFGPEGREHAVQVLHAVVDH